MTDASLPVPPMVEAYFEAAAKSLAESYAANIMAQSFDPAAIGLEAGVFTLGRWQDGSAFQAWLNETGRPGKRGAPVEG